MQNKPEKYQKIFISMRYWLIGMSYQNPEYQKALEALEFAKHYHIGVRKDGKTPEFQHQIEIAHFLRTLVPILQFPAQTLACSFLHDLMEDYNISRQEILSRFGEQIAHGTFLLTKEFNGQKRDPIELFNEMANSPIASVIKGVDRINNHQSMAGVFSIEKQKKYIQETREFIIPMLKKARHIHVSQEMAYENIKYVLNSQMSFVEEIIKASTSSAI